MSKDLKVEVTTLGRVLEGEGKIKSTLPESEYEDFGGALQQSIVEVEEPNCAACIDGRCVKCQRDGSSAKTRPRKAGASVAPLAMMGLGNRLFVENLQESTANLDDLSAESQSLDKSLGNRQAGHDVCGAAKELVKHIKTVAEFDPNGPTISFVKAVVKDEHPAENVDEMTLDVKKNAVAFGEVLEIDGWDGQEFVDGIAEQDPAAVEVLETKEDEVDGHAEGAVVIVDGPVDNDGRPIHTIDERKLKELTGREAFVVNLNEMRRDATLLGHSEKQKAQLLLAGLMHLGAVYKNLGDSSQPVFLVQVA